MAQGDILKKKEILKLTVYEVYGHLAISSWVDPAEAKFNEIINN